MAKIETFKIQDRAGDPAKMLRITHEDREIVLVLDNENCRRLSAAINPHGRDVTIGGGREVHRHPDAVVDGVVQS